MDVEQGGSHYNDFISKSNTSSPSSTFDASGMFDQDFFASHHTNIIYPDTPSSASSSELSTPTSSSGRIDFACISFGNGDGVDVDMDQCFGGELLAADGTTGTPLDYPNHLLSALKSNYEELPVDWTQLLATLCDEHPEAVQWFAETGGFQVNSDVHIPTSSDECNSLLQSQSTSTRPDSHSHMLSPILQDSTSLSTFASALASHLPSPSDITPTTIPLRQPQPVRPIPPIPLKALTAAAAVMRPTKPRGPRPVEHSLTPDSLLCQPVEDAVRCQRRMPKRML